ncbi:MAG: trypsin-like serine protease [Acidobacteria bacterium]|nr:trypsin-like serine protease [Acidobacteriota bacterium]
MCRRYSVSAAPTVGVLHRPACYTRPVSASDFDTLLRRTVLVVLSLIAFAVVGSHMVAPDGAIWPEVDLGGPAPQLRVGTSATPWTEVARVLSPAVVVIEVYADGRGRSGPAISSGSGVVVRSDGYVVTNAHVVDGGGDINVVLESGISLPASLVGGDRGVDIAVLQVESPEPLVAAALGDSSDLEVGEWVVAVGAPFRLNGTVSTGIVSALDRRVRSLSLTSPFIQTDAAINPGNSGGPLANLRGEVIGINTAIAVSEEAQRTQTGAYAGVGFAIPVNTVRRVASRLIGRAGLLPSAEPTV